MKPRRSVNTSKPIALVVVGILGVFALAALGSGVHLVALIIRIPDKDGTLIAVYVSLVAQVFGLASVAVAGMVSLLASVDKSQAPLNPDGTLAVAGKDGEPVKTEPTTHDLPQTEQS